MTFQTQFPGGGSAKAASAATAYSMIMQAINTASVDGGYKIAEVQGVFVELAPLLDPALSISSAKISEAFDNANDANSLASSSVFRDLVNGNIYLDDLGRASSELFQYYGGYAWADVEIVSGDTYDPDDGTEPNNSIWISPDGTEMVWIDSSDDIRSGPLSTPYDPNSVTPRAGTFNTSTQSEGVPLSLFVKPDGTKLYITGNNLDDIMQWTLSTPFDLSTATYDGARGLNNVPRSLNFSEDGLVLVYTHFSGAVRAVLNTAWDPVGGGFASTDASAAAFMTGAEVTYINNGYGLLHKNGGSNQIDRYEFASQYAINGLGTVVGSFDYNTDIPAGVSLVSCADRYDAESSEFVLVSSGAYHLSIPPTELKPPS